MGNGAIVFTSIIVCLFVTGFSFLLGYAAGYANGLSNGKNKYE